VVEAIAEPCTMMLGEATGHCSVMVNQSERRETSSPKKSASGGAKDPRQVRGRRCVADPAVSPPIPL
jgi:hypothetical protein